MGATNLKIVYTIHIYIHNYIECFIYKKIVNVNEFKIVKAIWFNPKKSVEPKKN